MGTSASNNPPGPLTTSEVIGCYKYGEIPSLLDHINRNPHDNRYENLRPASHSWNSFNRNAAVNGTGKSPYRGVSWHGSHNGWWAQFRKEGKKRYLGLFPGTDQGEIEAALAWDRAAFEEYGSDAIPNLNFPENKANYMGLNEHEQLEFGFCDESLAQQILDLNDVVLLR